MRLRAVHFPALVQLKRNNLRFYLLALLLSLSLSLVSLPLLLSPPFIIRLNPSSSCEDERIFPHVGTCIKRCSLNNHFAPCTSPTLFLSESPIIPSFSLALFLYIFSILLAPVTSVTLHFSLLAFGATLRWRGGWFSSNVVVVLFWTLCVEERLLLLLVLCGVWTHRRLWLRESTNFKDPNHNPNRSLSSSHCLHFCWHCSDENEPMRTLSVIYSMPRSSESIERISCD